MKPVIKTASALLFMTTFAACTHYTLPDDPVERKLERANATQPANDQAQPMKVAQTMPVAQAMPAVEAKQAEAQAAAPAAPPVAAAPVAPAPAVAMPAQNKPASECRGDSHYINAGGKPVPKVKVRATGYGAPPKSFYSEPQRRLMAMRAAKVDAYRSLAERINGVQIWGGTTLGDMVVEKDRFRVYLDTHLRGARVIAENPHEDGSFETIVEVSVGQSMLNQALPAKRDCVEPNAPQHEARNADYMFSSASLLPPSRVSKEEPMLNSNFYYQGE